MTRHEVHKILEIPFLDRHQNGLQTFEWEHCAKSFFKIPSDLAINHLIRMSTDILKEKEDLTILSCENDSDVYYFGIGLDDCDNITLGELKKLYNHGVWYVYTWCD